MLASAHVVVLVQTNVANRLPRAASQLEHHAAVGHHARLAVATLHLAVALRKRLAMTPVMTVRQKQKLHIDR